MSAAGPGGSRSRQLRLAVVVARAANRALGFVQLEGTNDRIEDAIRDCAEVPPLESRKSR